MTIADPQEEVLFCRKNGRLALPVPPALTIHQLYFGAATSVR
jgi:hypothetical protein